MDPITATGTGLATAGAGGAGASTLAGLTGAAATGAAVPTAAGLGAGAAGLGAGGLASLMPSLPTLMKVAPLVMTAGSLVTKDKTLKDLLGVGALVSGGANLISNIGSTMGAGAAAAGNVANQSLEEMAKNTLATGASSTAAGAGSTLKDMAGAFATGAPVGETASKLGTVGLAGSRLNDVLPMMAAASQLGGYMGGSRLPAAPQQFTMQPATPMVTKPSSYVGTPVTDAAKQRFLDYVSNHRY